MGLYRAYTGITGIKWGVYRVRIWDWKGLTLGLRGLVWGVYRVRIWDCIGLILGLRGLYGGYTGLEYGTV